MKNVWNIVKEATMNNPYSAPSLLLKNNEAFGNPGIRDMETIRDRQRSLNSTTSPSVSTASGSAINDLTSNISIDSLTTGNVGITIFIQLLCCAIFLYASYINVKCHCPSFWLIAWYGILIACCPLCTVPYLLYKKFSSKCYY